MRVLYTALFRLLTPLVVVHQLWRSWPIPCNCTFIIGNITDAMQ